jgi:WD repeat-containing protein 81
MSRERESSTLVSKLRSDIVRGNLMQMEILPLNRLLLLGTDTGSINLIC